MNSPFASRMAVWLCLAGVLAASSLYLAWLPPENLFGLTHDDTIYFSSAQALAQGRGYIIPSLPGTPPQTKYPVLYPWLLSWIWRWWPAFPANVTAAVRLTAAFGSWFLVAAFLFLRKLAGVGDWRGLLIVALCALHPVLLLLNTLVMSDLPFLALAMTAVLVADRAMRRDGGIGLAVLAGVLAALSVGMRVLGVAIIAGIVAIAMYRRAYRQAAVFCLFAAPCLAFVLWPHGPASLAPDASGAAQVELGWRQTFYYYTSYAKFWEICVPNIRVFLVMLNANGQALLKQPADYLLATLMEGRSHPQTILFIVLSLGILAGIIRQARAQEWKPAHAALVFYAAAILPWHYAILDRFLTLFLPLFYAGAWVEGRHTATLLRANLGSGRSRGEKLLAGIFALALLTVALGAAWNYVDGRRWQLRAVSAERAAMLRQKREAYDWIRRNTGPAVPMVACEDVALYLYTGRQAVRPIAFSTEAILMKDTRVLKRDLAHITDAARHIGARLWLAADDDFWSEDATAQPHYNRRMAELKAVLPAVFRSSENRVQILDLSCLYEPQRVECRKAAPVLFPAGPD